MKLYTTIKIAMPVLMLALAATSCKEEANAADKIPDNAVAASANTAEENEQAQQVAAANEAVVMQAQSQGQSVQQFTVPPAAATNTVTAPGMNPPHGQPGHRCEIPVGAPLNSAPPKPTQDAKATITPGVNPPTNFAPPAAKDAAAAAADVVTPPGMNPPHGQPGHLCSVAVGAPLPTE